MRAWGLQLAHWVLACLLLQRTLGLLRQAVLLLLRQSLLLDLYQAGLHLFLEAPVIAVHDGSGQDHVALLPENIVNLAVLAANVEEEAVFLLESCRAQPTLHVLHDPRELLGKLLHEVPTAVLLQHVETAQLLLADLALQVEVALRVQRHLLP